MYRLSIVMSKQLAKYKAFELPFSLNRSHSTTHGYDIKLKAVTALGWRVLLLLAPQANAECLRAKWKDAALGDTGRCPQYICLISYPSDVKMLKKHLEVRLVPDDQTGSDNIIRVVFTDNR